MSNLDGHIYVARRNPTGHLVPLSERGSLIIPGVTDPLELKDLVQAVLEKKGLKWTDWNKHLEQAEIDHEYRIKVALASRELRRRIEGQVPRKVDKFMPRRVI